MVHHVQCFLRVGIEYWRLRTSGQPSHQKKQLRPSLVGLMEGKKKKGSKTNPVSFLTFFNISFLAFDKVSIRVLSHVFPQ